jgi:hypothetical protein
MTNKINKLEFYLNAFHFCFYRAHYKLHLLANKINPGWLLLKIPSIKKRHKKLGIDIHKEIDKAFGDKNFLPLQVFFTCKQSSAYDLLLKFADEF